AATGAARRQRRLARARATRPNGLRRARPEAAGGRKRQRRRHRRRLRRRLRQAGGGGELWLRRLRLPLVGGGVRRARLDRAAALPDDAAHHGRVALTSENAARSVVLNPQHHSGRYHMKNKALATLATI